MPLLHIKDGVNLTGIKAELLDGLLTAAVVFHVAESVLVVTALTDGTHKIGSLHYRGYAADLRARDIPKDKLAVLLGTMKAALGPKFDVILEVDAQAIPHFHLEYDPQHDGGKTLH
jgi:hypothetical protein